MALFVDLKVAFDSVARGVDGSDERTRSEGGTNKESGTNAKGNKEQGEDRRRGRRMFLDG